jgi:hypothetical protein
MQQAIGISASASACLEVVMTPSRCWGNSENSESGCDRSHGNEKVPTHVLQRAFSTSLSTYLLFGARGYPARMRGTSSSS